MRNRRLNGLRQAVGLELGAHLRDVVAEHDDVVLGAAAVAHMLAQQRLAVEAEPLEKRPARIPHAGALLQRGEACDRLAVIGRRRH